MQTEIEQRDTLKYKYGHHFTVREQTQTQHILDSIELLSEF